MAERTKYQWRGRTYYRKSLRPGKKTVRVKAHCRRRGGFLKRYFERTKSDWPF